MLEWQDIFWLKCLILDRRLHFPPTTPVLLSSVYVRAAPCHSRECEFAFRPEIYKFDDFCQFSLYLLYF